MSRILIVDNQVLFRNTLRSYLAQDPNFHIVGVAGNMRDAIWSVASLRPDLVLTELTMPDARGIEAVAGIKRHYPEVKVLVLSYQREDEFKRRCRDAGVVGYVVKGAIHDELFAVIRAALSGKNDPGMDVPETLAKDYLRASAARNDRLGHVAQTVSLH